MKRKLTKLEKHLYRGSGLLSPYSMIGLAWRIFDTDVQVVEDAKNLQHRMDLEMGNPETLKPMDYQHQNVIGYNKESTQKLIEQQGNALHVSSWWDE